MIKSRWLTIGGALALAVVMLWAVPALAQGRGKGQWGQAGQGWGCGQNLGQGQGMAQGQGAGYGSCPNYPGYQNSQGNWGNNPQGNLGGWGPRGGGRNSQPNPQAPAPPPSQ